MNKKYTIVLVICAMALTMLASCGCSSDNDGTIGSDMLSGTGAEGEMSWQEQYDLGIRLLNEGNYEDAILAFTAAIQINPKSVQAYVGRANVYASWAETVLNDAYASVDEGQTLVLSDVKVITSQGEATLEDLYQSAVDDYKKAQELIDSGEATDELTGAEAEEVAKKEAEALIGLAESLLPRREEEGVWDQILEYLDRAAALTDDEEIQKHIDAIRYSEPVQTQTPDENIAAEKDYIYKMEYGDLPDTETEVTYDGGVTTFHYSEDGQLIQETGSVIGYSHAMQIYGIWLGRWGYQGTADYTYDSDGKLIKMRKAETFSTETYYQDTEYQYNDQGQLVLEIQYDSYGEESIRIQYAYNESGYLTKAVESAAWYQEETLYHPDENGRLLSYEKSTYYVELRYEENGHIAREEVYFKDENGNIERGYIAGAGEYFYDESGRLTVYRESGERNGYSYIRFSYVDEPFFDGAEDSKTAGEIVDDYLSLIKEDGAIISLLEEEGVFVSGWTDDYLKYTIIDIDEDGIPELVMESVILKAFNQGNYFILNYEGKLWSIFGIVEHPMGSSSLRKVPGENLLFYDWQSETDTFGTSAFYLPADSPSGELTEGVVRSFENFEIVWEGARLDADEKAKVSQAEVISFYEKDELLTLQSVQEINQ